LLEATIKDGRWDLKYLGMQIIIEGLAMAAFGNLLQITQEPLLKELIRYVMKDESRHVAFGVLSLSDHYRDMASGELADREEFVIYACELMRDRLVGDQISSVMGWNREEVRQVVLASAPAQTFRRLLFARVVPNLGRLGLLDGRRPRRDGARAGGGRGREQHQLRTSRARGARAGHGEADHPRPPLAALGGGGARRAGAGRLLRARAAALSGAGQRPRRAAGAVPAAGLKRLRARP